jgi:excisionase family DNA binding protein
MTGGVQLFTRVTRIYAGDGAAVPAPAETATWPRCPCGRLAAPPHACCRARSALRPSAGGAVRAVSDTLRTISGMRGASRCFGLGYTRVLFRAMARTSTLLTIDEVAERLRVSRRTAYRLVKEMARAEIGGRVLVPEAELERYIESKLRRPEWSMPTEARAIAGPLRPIEVRTKPRR